LWVPPLCVVGGFAFLNRHHQLDDALIVLRYVRNLQAGLGLVYNPGELFNGLTSPLYVLILSVSSLLLSDLQSSMVVVSGVFLFGASIVGGQLFSRSRAEAIFTSLMIAASGFFYSTMGMETSLFVFLLGVTLCLYKRESDAFVLSLALLTITRGEGALLAVPLLGDCILRPRRLPATRWLVGAGFVIATPLLFNLAYYGDALPATLGAKIGQGASGLWAGGWSGNWLFLNLEHVVNATFSGRRGSALFFVCLSLYGARHAMPSSLMGVTCVFLGLLFGFYLLLNVPYYVWYYGPFVYFAIIFSSRALAELLVALRARPRTAGRAAVVLLLCVLAVRSFAMTVSFEERVPNQSYVAAGTWIRHHTPQGSSVAMVEIGTVGWYSERPVVDLLGLVSPYNAGHLARREFNAWLSHDQPDYMLRHEPPTNFERSIVRLESLGAYRRVTACDCASLVLLARAGGVSRERVKALAGAADF
jgi:arabinofuranosyltransferase